MLCYAKSLQSCPTLCDPIDSSPPGSPVPGILQARTLEWVALSFSNAWKWKEKVKSLSRVRLLATPWTAAHQAPPSMGFSRQEYWSWVPLPSPIWPKKTQRMKISMWKDAQSCLPRENCKLNYRDTTTHLVGHFNAKYGWYQLLAKMWSNMNPHSLLLGMQNITNTL